MAEVFDCFICEDLANRQPQIIQHHIVVH